MKVNLTKTTKSIKEDRINLGVVPSSQLGKPLNEVQYQTDKGDCRDLHLGITF